MYLAAAQVMKEGGDPYDHRLLYRTEKAMLARQGLRITNNSAIVRVGNPPLFYWLLEPFSGLPFQPVALGMIIFLYLASLGGFLGCLYYLRWKRFVLPSIIFLMMPQVVLGAFYGNNLGLIFAAVGAALALIRRYPFVAGLALTLAWIKPPVALPIVMLIVTFHSPARGRVGAGFGVGTLGALGLTVVALGWHLLRFWSVGLVGYSKDMRFSPDIASLAGLYVRWAPYHLRLAAGAVLLVMALVLTALTWRRLRHKSAASPLAVGWLWILWLLVTPYAHFSDEMLLTVPLLALLGPAGRALPHRIPTAALYLAAVSLVLFSWDPMHVQLLCLPLLAVAACLAFAAKQQPAWATEGAGATLSLLSGSRLKQVDHSGDHGQPA
jgi:hypothetical protein